MAGKHRRIGTGRLLLDGTAVMSALQVVASQRIARIDHSLDRPRRTRTAGVINPSLVHIAREAFIAEGWIPDQLRHAVRPEIAMSWSRSRAAGVSPQAVAPITEWSDTNSALLRVSEPILSQLAESLIGFEGVLAIADGSGQGRASWRAGSGVLDSSGGGLYLESTVGTNGIGTAIADGCAKVISGPEHWSDAYQQRTCVAVPVIHPVTRRPAAVLTMVLDDADAHPAVTALIRWAAAQIKRELAAQVDDADRWLFDQFMSRRRSTHPILLISPSLCVADSMAAQLAPEIDLPALIEEMTAGGGGSGPHETSLELRDGVMVPVTVTALLGKDVGVVVELQPTSRPSQRRSAVRVTPSSFYAAALDSALGAAKNASMLLTGEPGVGKATMARTIFRDQVAEGQFAAVEGQTAAADPERWCQKLSALLLHNEVVLVTHLDRLGNDAFARFLPLLNDVVANSCRARIVATARESPLLDDPREPAAKLAVFGQFAGTEVEVPPLRHRESDVPALVEAIMTKDGRRARWSTGALDALLRKNWPGNIRELENVVKRTLSQGSALITREDLPLDVRQGIERHHLTWMERIERDAILAALHASGGNKVIAALELGISRSSLYRKLRQFGI